MRKRRLRTEGGGYGELRVFGLGLGSGGVRRRRRVLVVFGILFLKEVGKLSFSCVG